MRLRKGLASGLKLGPRLTQQVEDGRGQGDGDGGEAQNGQQGQAARPHADQCQAASAPAVLADLPQGRPSRPQGDPAQQGEPTP